MVGDETGMILFTTRNDQVHIMKPEMTFILRNAKIDMFRGSMRLVVNKWVKILLPQSSVHTDYNTMDSHLLCIFLRILGTHYLVVS
jgi:hypothetical protein